MTNANRITRLLKLREQQVTLAEIDVQHASKQVRETKSRLDRLETSINQLTARVSPNELSNLIQLSQVVMASNSERNELEGELFDRQIRLAQVTEQLVKAKTSAEALSRLNDKRVAERNALLTREEQLRLDEVVALSWTKSGQEDG